jgi:hypothetical protein
MTGIDDPVGKVLDDIKKGSREFHDNGFDEEKEGYDDNDNDYLIPFELHPEIIEKDIVRRYVLDSRTKNIIIELNHTYRGKRANIAAKDYQNVQKLRDGIKKYLVKEKGISEDHAKLLADVIDNNADILDDAYFAYDNKKNSNNNNNGAGSTAKHPHFTNSLYDENDDISRNTFTIVLRNSMLPVLFDANFRDKQLANVSAHWLKPSEPSEPSAMNVGCSSVNNKNGDGKPTTTATMSTTTATATNNAIYRLGHTATWAYRNCKIKADIWFMQIHDCSGIK